MTARARDAEDIITRSEHGLSNLARCVGEVASVRSIPYALELGLHPWLACLEAGRGTQTTKWVSVLSCILYRCDDITQFEDFAAAKKDDAQLKRKRQKRAKPFLEDARKQLTLNLVLSRAATDHLHVFMPESQLMSLPALQPGKTCYFEPVQRYLDIPMTKAVPNSFSAALAADIIMDVEENDALPQNGTTLDAVGGAERTYFCVVKNYPGRQRLQSKDAAAGRRLQNHQFVVMVLGNESFAPERHRCLLPLGAIESESVSLFSCFSTDIEWLAKNLQSHEEDAALMYTMQSCVPFIS